MSLGGRGIVAKLDAIIRTVMPNCKDPSLWALHLGYAMDSNSITSDDRMDDFLAQLAVESQELNRTSENLNYSAERLRAVWPKRFPTDADAVRCAHNPERLANEVYGGRMGNIAPGDGWLYRGRGLIQITGKDNYRRMSELMGMDLVSQPDKLAEPHYAAYSAAAYWKDRGLNELADAGNDKADFVSITRAINGGTEGLDKRQLYWTRARTALGLSGLA